MKEPHLVFLIIPLLASLPALHATDIELTETLQLPECHSIGWVRANTQVKSQQVWDGKLDEAKWGTPSAAQVVERNWAWKLDEAQWKRAVQQKGEGKKEDVKFDLWMPGDIPHAKGIVVISGHGSGEYLYCHPELRKLARELHLAIFKFIGNPMQRGFWPKSLLYERLKTFGEKSGHPELEHAPLFLYGHSNGTGFSAIFPATEGARVWAWVSMRPGITFQVYQSGAAQVPGLVIFGEDDPFLARPSRAENLAVVELMRRKHNALWNFAVEPKTGHGPGEKTWPLVFSFLRHTFAARVPADCDPRKGSMTLRQLQVERGCFGRNWDAEKGGYQTLPVAPFADFTGDKTVASWLLNAGYAADWQQFQREGHLGNAHAVEGQVDGSVRSRPRFVPDFKIKPNDYTVLMAADAKMPSGAKPFQAGAHGKFHVTAWTRPEQVFEWEVTAPQDDDYAVNVLLRRQGSQPLTVEVTGMKRRLSATVPATMHAWTRQSLDGLLRLTAGKQRLVLQAHAPNPTNNFDASILSIELVRPATRDYLHAAALKLRADTRWLQECRYGLMCHWTTESCPRRGERKTYAQAVQDFDVEGFVKQVQATGAGFIVLTTSHAQHFFPAPLESLKRILPSRTAPRDLVAELAEALGRRGVKLFLYYHLGAINDPAWLKATGFWETDTSRLFDNWEAIISEVGRRYGDKLAGWWFDDGAVSYYYRSAPWERLATAAKAGYAARLVAFNPWELPSPTEFQDYFCGEGHGDPSVGGLLDVGGDGHFRSGSHQGLQACATLIAEKDWVHARKDTDIGPPRWTAVQLAALLKEFIARKNVPIFNLEIYQEGTFSPATVEMFRAAQDLTKKAL